IELLDPEERRETLGLTLFYLDGILKWWGRGRKFAHCTPQQGNHEATEEKLHSYRHICSPSKCILNPNDTDLRVSFFDAGVKPPVCLSNDSSLVRHINSFQRMSRGARLLQGGEKMRAVWAGHVRRATRRPRQELSEHHRVRVSSTSRRD